jgi:hypothetical protein
MVLPQAEAKESTGNVLTSIGLCWRQRCQLLTLVFFVKTQIFRINNFKK